MQPQQLPSPYDVQLIEARAHRMRAELLAEALSGFGRRLRRAMTGNGRGLRRA